MSVGQLVGWSVGRMVGRSVGGHKLKNEERRISAPAHPSATGGRVSGLVFPFILPCFPFRIVIAMEAQFMQPRIKETSGSSREWASALMQEKGIKAEKSSTVGWMVKSLNGHTKIPENSCY